MLYKVLDERGRSMNGGCAHWALPVKHSDGTWEPGEWLPRVVGEEVRRQSCHAVPINELFRRLGPRIFVAEHRDAMDADCQETEHRDIRLLYETQWDNRRARLFAADCASHVLGADADPRLLAAIGAGRQYAYGEIGRDQLESVERAASHAAMEAAFAAATPDASHAAWISATAAASAAKYWAGYLAAEGAASAAESAARRQTAKRRGRGGNERAWQAERLRMYLHDEGEPEPWPLTV